MKTTAAVSVVFLSLLAACSSTDAERPPPASESNPTTVAPSPTSSSGDPVQVVPEQFRAALNSRDNAEVARLAPTTPEGTVEFIVGGSPYPNVDCHQRAGRDECRVVNGIADFVFVVDVDSGLVSAVTYVGGE